MPGWLLVYLLAINVVTAGTYAWDKRQSRRPGARRIRERTLWILCLGGGVVGAWIVFLGMRHKTLHRSFWIVQSVASALWAVIVVAILLR